MSASFTRLPPLMPMNDADKEKLFRDFDAIGFQLPLAA